MYIAHPGRPRSSASPALAGACPSDDGRPADTQDRDLWSAGWPGAEATRTGGQSPGKTQWT